MAETAGEPTPTWISFHAACELGLGQRWLKLKLKAKLIRWRARDVHPPGASLDGLWDDPEQTVQPDGSAKKLIGVSDSDAGIGFDYVTVFGIEIAREDVLKQLSLIAESETPPVESETTSPAKPETTPPLSSIESETAPLPTTKWVVHAIEECGPELVGLSKRKAAKRMEEWAKDGKDGLRKPQKPIGWSRIRTIAAEQGLLPVKSAGN